MSLAHSLFLEALPMLSLFDKIRGEPFDLEICEDNQATTIIIAKAGFSQKLRHISRTHKVNLGSIKEVLDTPSCDIQYIDTKEQAADIFRKALEPQKWGNALELLGLSTGEERAALVGAVSTTPPPVPHASRSTDVDGALSSGRGRCENTRDIVTIPVGVACL